ncbi:MAG: flagellar basal body-associated FliL family protein [Pseudomonadota bacterium]
MADDETPEDGEKKPSLVKKLLIPVVLVAISSGATFAGLKFTGMLDPAPAAAQDGAEGTGEGGDDSATAGGNHVGKPAHFYTLYPDLLVNFSSDGRPAYLKLSVDIMAHDEGVIAGVEQFQAIIRNNLLSAFQDVEFNSAERTESIEALRELATEEIRSVLKNYHGNANIEGVYFTSFVVQ